MNVLLARMLTRTTSSSHGYREERLFSEGKRLVSEGMNADPDTVKAFTRELISLYDSPYNSGSRREQAAQIVGQLADQHDVAFDLVIDSARRYANMQHIDDAFPYNPNGFDVLSGLTRRQEKAIQFLRNVVQNDWGIPRWAALEAICKFIHPEADDFIAEIIRGRYPPKHYGQKEDLYHIRSVKGQGYIDKYAD